MFYDLNIPWPCSSQQPAASSSSSSNQPKRKQKHQASQKKRDVSPSSANQEDSNNLSAQGPISFLNPTETRNLTEIVEDLQALGYSYVAFNNQVEIKFDPNLHSNPFQPTRDGRPRPPFPGVDPRTTRAANTSTKGKSRSTPSFGQGLTQLSRMTLLLDDSSLGKAGTGLINSNAGPLQSYDLLAVKPLTESTFQHACISLSELKPFGIDIISLDFTSSPRLPFFLKRSTVNAALENGVMFEICYGPAVGSCSTSDGNLRADPQSMAKARRNLISGVRDLLRITNGKGVFFSSGVSEALGLRGPYDVINLATIFGMTNSAARDALSSNCYSLLMRARTRKTFRGVVGHPVVQSAPKVWSQGGESLSQSDPNTSSSAAATLPSLEIGGKKRKGEDFGDEGGEEPEEEGGSGARAGGGRSSTLDPPKVSRPNGTDPSSKEKLVVASGRKTVKKRRLEG
ncbi:PHP domain-like protein [Violaceomyces palustris]|uniref:PHP domain-like protein n=1 Tax=Violaceomyces palustris TaxID=1673888 RepID=A0ACD0P8A7_9BASI|nr:PHP domain-like protein [Violaceomyces palustris]